MEHAFKAFLKRILPDHYRQIQWENSGEENIFAIRGKEGHICIQAGDINTACRAVGEYLKYDAGVHLSWCGCRTELGETLPAPTPVRREIVQKYRVYMNYCTHSYSAAWWDWERWEKEIDYMALNGVNMPLSVVGIEGVWYNTLVELGFSDDEARTFLSGPCFLAWQWMTNIEGFCGPLPKSWIEAHIKLGQQILARERKLGMTPIQQGFSGFVPRLFKEKMPSARIQMEEAWCNIPGTAQMDPTDPAFGRIGRIFLENQKRLFGGDGFYAADPFHEGAPPVNTPEYLHDVGKAIDRLLREFDPQSVWVMQSWSIRREIAQAVPKERLLILDLGGYRHHDCQGFWGYPFVTGRLHNFGARTNLHGDLIKLSENHFMAVRRECPNATGTGLFMEGIGQNPVYYDLAFDMLCRQEPFNIDIWLAEYAFRRYGVRDASAVKAWQILLDSVYAEGSDGVEYSSIIAARPAVDVKKSGPNSGFCVPYGNKRLFKAIELLLQCDSISDGYQYDLVDFTRQMLSNYGQDLYRQVSQAYKNREADRFLKYSRQFLELLENVDRLLSQRKEFSLKKWIGDAKSWGENEQEQAYYEYCASVLLTLWGTEEEPYIFDYAWKEWSGMIHAFYKKRWEMFFDMLLQRLRDGLSYREEGLPQVYGREAFRANDFYKKLADFEIQWCGTPKEFEEIPAFSIKDEARRLLGKYREKIL